MKRAFPALLGLLLLLTAPMGQAQFAYVNPVLGITPMSYLTFSNLSIGGVYQLQQSVAWYWTNLPVNFTAATSTYTQLVVGIVGATDYRLVLGSVPAQAFAVAQEANGLVNGATVTSGGSGYLTNPTINIVAGAGSNATAVAQIAGGAVTNLTITSPGNGYTNAPIMEIDPPPAVAISPATLPVMRVDSASLVPSDSYQLQFTPAIGATWENWTNGLFSSTATTNSQFLFIADNSGFFRLQSVTAIIDQNTSTNMSAAALSQSESQIITNMMAVGDVLNFDYTASHNYVNPAGFTSGVADPGNVNYDFYADGTPMSPALNGGADWAQNIANLFINPRPPVFIQTNVNSSNLQFNFWVDLNRNGRFETNGFLPELGTNGLPVQGSNGFLTNFYNGEPEWIGVLKYPNYPHSATNPFVGRYAFLVLPIGKTLDFNFIHNYSKSLIGGPPATMPPPPFEDGFLRDQGVGSWELNLAGMLCGLNTNSYPPGVTSYSYTSTAAPNTGFAFDDAYSFLRFRYGDGNGLPGSFANTFPAPFTPDYFQESIDEYASETNTTANAIPWPGNNGSNLFNDIQDVFNPSKTSPAFANNLITAGISLDSYDRYTFQRMITGIGTDSAPELQSYVYDDGITTNPAVQFPARLRTKVNINYDNTSEIANGLNTSPFPLQSWPNALAFFTNAAESLLRSQDFPLTNYDLSGNPTNVVFNHFGLTNIPVYSSTNPSIRYSENLHRMLQVAANIYAATQTNSAFPSNSLTPSLMLHPVPPVFRPLFFTTNYGGSNQNLFIVGYTYVSATQASAQLAGVFKLPSDPTITTNDNVWGIPWVIGVQKGLPQFDRYSFANSWEVARKLIFARYPIIVNGTNAGDPTRPPQYTNQLYIMSVSNVFGMDALNDYPTNLAYSYQVIVSNFVSVTLTNNSASNPYSFTTNFGAVSNVVNSFWPGWGWRASPSMTNGMLSFLQANGISFPVAYYSPSENAFIPVALNTPTNPVGAFLPGDLVQTTWPYYSWSLNVSCQMFYALLDSSNNVLDFVNLGPIVTSNSINLLYLETQQTGTLAGGGNPGVVLNPWDPTPVPGLPTQGVLNQINSAIGFDPILAAELRGQTAAGTQPNYQIYFFSTNYATVSGIIPLNQSLEVNDPLVHYTLGDLTSPILAISSPTIATNQILTRNFRYEAWPMPNNPHGNAAQFVGPNVVLKDPLIYSSAYWNFPNHNFPSIGLLGQVHRGTPWQTIFLKADPDESIGTGFLPNHTAWIIAWVSTLDTYPTNDYALLDLFTAAPNDNASRGLLSVNQTNDAPWYALFSGLSTVNNAPIDPTEIGVLLNNTNNTGINYERSLEPNQIFHKTGNILKAPILTIASPFLPGAATNCTDAEVERIPQQIMGLLKVGLPRFVVYGYGQALKPRDFYFGSNNYGICTNYQISGQFVTKTVFHISGDSVSSNPKIQIDSFNILPANDADPASQ